jgi:hypothetical protein
MLELTDYVSIASEAIEAVKGTRHRLVSNKDWPRHIVSAWVCPESEIGKHCEKILCKPDEIKEVMLPNLLCTVFDIVPEGWEKSHVLIIAKW